MRFVFVTQTFPQGSETFIVNKFAGLVERGLDVWVHCREFDQRAWERFPQLRRRADLRRRVRTGWPSKSRWLPTALLPAALLRAFAMSPAAAWKYIARGWKRFGSGILRRFYIDAELIALSPSLVHFEFGTLALGRTYLRDVLGCKITVSFRGFDLNYAGLEQAGHFDEVWRRADAIHCLGEELWKKAQRRGCPAAMPKRLIAPAIETDFFGKAVREYPAAGTAAHPLRLLSVGSLEWKKGYEFAIQAARMLRDRGVAVDYRIAGEGKYLETLSFCCRQLEMENSVTFLGALPPERVREEMNAAHVFVHAAVTEGFCNAVLEAQAMALPVVATDAGGLVENVADGITGFIVPRRNPAAMAERLAALAAAPALRRRMAEEGPRRVRAKFNLDRQLDAFAGWYREVAAA